MTETSRQRFPIPSLQEIEKCEHISLFRAPSASGSNLLTSTNNHRETLHREWYDNSWKLDIDLQPNDGGTVSLHRSMIEKYCPEFLQKYGLQLQPDRCNMRTKYCGYKNTQSWMINIPELDYRTLRYLVDYLYRIDYDCLELSSDGSLKIAESADKICFTAVRDHAFQSCKMTIQNCYKLLQTALRFGPGAGKLLQECYEFWRCNFTEIVTQTMNHVYLNYSILQTLLADDRLEVCCEVIVWKCIAGWISADSSARLKYLWDLFALVRLRFIQKSDSILQIIPELMELHRSTGFMLDKHYQTFCKTKTFPPATEYRPRIPNELLFIFGGKQNGCVSSQFWILDLKHKSWFNLLFREAPARCYHACVFVEEKFYIVGGFNGEEVMSTLICFDTNTMEFTELSPMRKKRAGHDVIFYDGRLFVFGGYNKSEFYSVVECYDIENDSWTFVGALMLSRSFAKAALLNNRVYITGGCDDYFTYNTVESFDLQTMECTLVSSMNTPRFSHCALTINDKIVVFGGNNSVEYSNTSRTVEIYDPQRDTWTRVNKMQASRDSFVGVVLGKSILAIGGYNGLGALESVEQCPLELLVPPNIKFGNNTANDTNDANTNTATNNNDNTSNSRIPNNNNNDSGINMANNNNTGSVAVNGSNIPPTSNSTPGDSNQVQNNITTNITPDSGTNIARNAAPNITNNVYNLTEGTFEHVLELELKQGFTSAGYSVGRSLKNAHYYTYYGQTWAFNKQSNTNNSNSSTISHHKFVRKILDMLERESDTMMKDSKLTGSMNLFTFFDTRKCLRLKWR